MAEEHKDLREALDHQSLLVGRIVSLDVGIDFALDLIVSALLGDEVAARVLLDGQNFDWKLRKAKRLLSLKRPDLVERFSAFALMAKEAHDERNRILHAQWLGFTDDTLRELARGTVSIVENQLDFGIEPRAE